MTDLTDIDAGYRTLSSEPVAAVLRRDVVQVEGPEAAGFLQGQLSQDVAGLAVGGSARSLLLEPTGKLGIWLRVTRLDPERFLLDAEAGAGARILARLNRFKLRTKAELTALEAVVVGLRGPGAAGDLADRGLRIEGLLARVPAPVGGIEGVDIIATSVDTGDLPLASPAVLEVVRVERGLPAMEAEIVDDVIPAELGQPLIDASVSFTKGCYTGQELVARIDSRGGNVPRRLRGIVLHGDAVPPVGAELTIGDKVVGTISSAVFSPALGAPIGLALVHRTVEPPAPAHLRWDGGAAEVEIRTLPLVP